MRRRCGGTSMPRVGVEQHRVVERDRSAIRREQAGDHIDDRRLARARRPEQRRGAARRLEAHAQASARRAASPRRRRARSYSPWKRIAARRASHSEAKSAANARAIAIRTSRPAAASPPGTWVKRVDRRRNRLRLAGNIRHEGDGGAELAQRAGKAQHHAGDDARQSQRQRDGEKHQAPVGAERRGGVFELAVDRLERKPDRAAPSAESP